MVSILQFFLFVHSAFRFGIQLTLYLKSGGTAEILRMVTDPFLVSTLPGLPVLPPQVHSTRVTALVVGYPFHLFTNTTFLNSVERPAWCLSSPHCWRGKQEDIAVARNVNLVSFLVWQFHFPLFVLYMGTPPLFKSCRKHTGDNTKATAQFVTLLCESQIRFIRL